jgi:hypothetical protein
VPHERLPGIVGVEEVFLELLLNEILVHL